MGIKIFKLLLLAGFVTSCTINRPITYKTEDIPPQKNQIISKLVLDIEEFSDSRMENSQNRMLFSKKRKTRINGERKCINSERHYKKEPVAIQFTQMLVDHFNQRNSFKKVVLNKKDTADYYITGNLSQFYGAQGFSSKAAVGAAFGIIGSLATSGAKTAGKIVFEITDLKIYNKNNEMVKVVGGFKKVYEEEFSADAYCWCIYENINLKLKEYFTQLIIHLENEIKKQYESELKIAA